MVLNLPKIPKLDDAIAALLAVDQRVASLESYVGRNDERISALEARQAQDAHGLAEHQAGAEHRRREISAIKAAMDRERWLTKLRRR